MAPPGGCVMIYYPENLWFLLLIIPVVYLFFKNFRLGKHDLFMIGGEWRKQQLHDVYLLRWFFSALVFILFMLFTVLALAGFVSRSRKITDLPSKGDIVFTFDISRSMLSDDIPPDRLKRSLLFAKNIIGELPAERYGIVVFKGRGVRIAPVTEDREAVLNRLVSLSPDILTSKGTNIEDGVKTAAASFPSGDDRRRFIILFTDGGALSGNLTDTIKILKEQNIDTIVIGAGTSEGKKLPILDKEGKPVFSKLDVTALKYFAAETGGHYFGMADDSAFSAVMRVLSSEISPSRVEVVRNDSYLFPLALALLFLFLYIIIRIIPWKSVFSS
jgi:Ca-activated chloride channel family protein